MTEPAPIEDPRTPVDEPVIASSAVGSRWTRLVRGLIAQRVCQLELGLQHGQVCRGACGMSGAWTSEDAVVAAKQALVQLGAESHELLLLRLGENALYRILGTDLLLRVARAGTDPRDVARTVMAATRLRANGVPVCEPAVHEYSGEPMVFENGVVSVWTYYSEQPDGHPDFSDFGRAIRMLHVSSGELAPILPSWKPLEVIRRRLRTAIRIGVPGEWVDDLAHRADDLEALLSTFEPVLSTGVIHGDAHVGNLVASEDGPILIDLDDLSNGPRDADFAPTIVQTRRFGLTADRWVEFTSAYGLPDPWMLHGSPLVRLRELFMIVWLLQQYGNSKIVDHEIELRIRSLDDHANSLVAWSAR